jgi:hypothetical protein
LISTLLGGNLGTMNVPQLDPSQNGIDALEASFSLSKDEGDFENDIEHSFEESNQTHQVYPSEIQITNPSVRDDETITMGSTDTARIKEVVQTCINDMLTKLSVSPGGGKSPYNVASGGMSPYNVASGGMSVETTHVSFANTVSTLAPEHETQLHTTKTTCTTPMNTSDDASHAISENTTIFVPEENNKILNVKPKQEDDAQRINSLLSSRIGDYNNDLGTKRGKGMV